MFAAAEAWLASVGEVRANKAAVTQPGLCMQICRGLQGQRQTLQGRRQTRQKGSKFMERQKHKQGDLTAQHRTDPDPGAAETFADIIQV